MNKPSEENRFWRWEFIIGMFFVVDFIVGIVLIGLANGFGGCG